MTSFAHIETGTVQDVRHASDVSAYKALFAGTDTSAWQIVAVADDVVEGSSITIAKTPVDMSGAQFQDWAAGVLAQVNTTNKVGGLTRLGAILSALESQRGTNGLLMIAWVRYNAAGVPGGRYTRSDFVTLIEALQNANIVTADEAAALTSNWTTQ